MTKKRAYIILDRSGSMQSKWKETMGAVNEYMNGLNSSEDGRNVLVSLVAFDNVSETIRRSVAVKDWESVTSKDVSPRGTTALFDSLSYTNSLILEDQADLVDIIVLTDGHENSSQEIKTKESAKSIIDAWKSKNYSLSFIGADFDAVQSGGSLGVSSSNTLNMSLGNYESSMKTRSAKSLAFYKSGSVLDTQFNEDDRLEASGQLKK